MYYSRDAALSSLILFLCVIGIPLLLLALFAYFFSRRSNAIAAPEESLISKVRTMLAQKKYAAAFGAALSGVYQSPWHWLISEYENFGSLARRQNFEDEQLLDLAREGLLGMDADHYTLDRRARFDALTDHWEKMRRIANLILSGGKPDISEAQWEEMRTELIKHRIGLMELQPGVSPVPVEN